ncbi:MAG: DMT family transporter [Gammaproteobacteria bacterium]
MPVSIAYLCVILIWSTTPLAIQWSTQGAGFDFAVASRMWLGIIVAALICVLLRARPPLDRRSCLTYLASGLGVYFGMTGAYWSSQYIPSGWISVIFGLAPIYTSILGSLFLGEKSVGLHKTGSLLLCILGLYVMFRGGTPDRNSFYGVIAVMLGCLGYALGIIAIKAVGARIRPLFTMTGTLVVSGILFTVTWYLNGAVLPAETPPRAAASIVYLGTIGSVLGFLLFYYVLQHVQATRAALITVIAPGCALALGNLLNAEPFTLKIITGAAMVLCGLLLFEFGAAIRKRITRTKTGGYVNDETSDTWKPEK